MRPFEYHPRNPGSWFNRAMRVVFRKAAIKEEYSQVHPTPQLSHDFTPLSSDNESEGMVEYHHLARSNRSGSDKTNVSSDEETKV